MTVKNRNFFTIFLKLIETFLLTFLQMNKITTTNEIDYTKASSIYDFIVKDTYGGDVALGEFCRGFVTLIVNIASSCGLTAPNYAQLTQINKDFDGSKTKILIIQLIFIKFPA